MAVQCGEFDIGRSGSRNCILGEFVDWGKWTCCHFVVVQRFCQSERLAGSRTGGPTPRLCGRLVGWINARAYFRTVLREMPSWRAISRRGSCPWILACCTAFQSASWRGDRSRPSGRDRSALLLTNWSSSSTTGSGSELVRCRSGGWLRRWLPWRFTMRPISGLGARAPWEARSTPGRGGAGRHGMISPLWRT